MAAARVTRDAEEESRWHVLAYAHDDYGYDETISTNAVLLLLHCCCYCCFCCCCCRRRRRRRRAAAAASACMLAWWNGRVLFVHCLPDLWYDQMLLGLLTCCGDLDFPGAPPPCHVQHPHPLSNHTTLTHRRSPSPPLPDALTHPTRPPTHPHTNTDTLTHTYTHTLSPGRPVNVFFARRGLLVRRHLRPRGRRAAERRPRAARARAHRLGRRREAAADGGGYYRG
jgi:hypothetical protein